jgi:tetratricopeptide (TPR) repeat protein
VFRIYCPVLALAVAVGALWDQTAVAQTNVPGLIPHVDLTATLDAGPYRPAFDDESAGVKVQFAFRPLADDDKLFHDAPAKEGGWQGLANVLLALTPSVDTSIPLTPSQITGRISAMLDEGQNQAALDVIEKRTAQLRQQATLGTDVQLMFLHGRALAALGRDNEAIAIYQDMTTRFPELPEPWNNLAAIYVKQGKLAMARDALNMALASNPNYATARSNLGDVELLLARQSFQDAARLGVGDAKAKAAKAEAILK